MQQPVRITKGTSVDIVGFEDFLEVPIGTEDGAEGENEHRIGTEGGLGQSEIRTEDRTEAQYVSPEEAANALGISVRAVLKRLAKGQLQGHKVPGKTKARWVVDLGSLPQVVHVEIANRKDGTEDRTESKNDIGTGTEGGLGQSETRTEDRTEDGTNLTEPPAVSMAAAYTQLVGVVDRQSKVIEQLTEDLRMKDAQIKLLTDRSHGQKSWWQRTVAFFRG